MKRIFLEKILDNLYMEEQGIKEQTLVRYNISEDGKVQNQRPCWRNDFEQPKPHIFQDGNDCVLWIQRDLWGTRVKLKEMIPDVAFLCEVGGEFMRELEDKPSFKLAVQNNCLS